MKKNKGVLVIAIITVLALLMVGCANSNDGGTPSEGTPTASAPAGTTPPANTGGFDPTNDIAVVSREDGSGTRGAFIELVGIVEDGVDRTTEEASITNSTAVMLTSVAGEPYAIGYVSLGSLNDTVKALKIEGVAPSVETIKDGSYKIARPFNIAYKGELSDVAQDFVDFILSAEGQKVVEDNGYITAVDDAPAFESKNPSGKIVVAGSSSVTPVMEKLKEAYIAVNSGADIEIQQSDSSTGMSSAIDGICDIGMASRELKDSEKAELTPVVIAIDGIAVIVNQDNPLEDITPDTVRDIFIGELVSWDEVE
ncbi:MAG: substrate-binding domain-containing protein [Christensenellales bacterium]